MTNLHPAAPTQPLSIGAPLPKELTTLHVDHEDLVDELRRAEIELIYALARHRKAWAAMRARQEERALLELKGVAGMLSDLASDTVWAKRTSDVKWWCAEVTAQSTAVLALKALLDGRSAAKGRRDRERVTKTGTARETVLGWEEMTIPTDYQYGAANAWMKISGGEPRGNAADLAHLRKLISTYEAAHPEVSPPAGV